MTPIKSLKLKIGVSQIILPADGCVLIEAETESGKISYMGLMSTDLINLIVGFTNDSKEFAHSNTSLFEQGFEG